MDQIRDCKRLHAQGMSIRQVSRELQISRNTVRNYLRGDQEPGVYAMKTSRTRQVKDKIKPFVLELFQREIELSTPRKQRLTAGRVHRLLKEEG